MTRIAVALSLVATALLGTAPAHAACTPATSSFTVNPLTWSVWRDGNGGYAFEWHGGGLVRMSDECASRLEATVTVTDHTSYGSPETVPGYTGYSYGPTPSGGEFGAAPRTDDFVVYFDPAVPTVRGRGVVEVRVSAAYVDAVTQETVPLRCALTRSEVTPLPTGPLVSTGPVEACA